jgi:hypothetical protein
LGRFLLGRVLGWRAGGWAARVHTRPVGPLATGRDCYFFFFYLFFSAL